MTTNNHFWFKALISPSADELARNSRNSFILLWWIARRASGMGSALIGDYQSMGMSEKEYRTAKTILEKRGYASFHGTPRGTVATILANDIFEIFKGEQRANKGRTEGELKGEPKGEPKGELNPPVNGELKGELEGSANTTPAISFNGSNGSRGELKGELINIERANQKANDGATPRAATGRQLGEKRATISEQNKNRKKESSNGQAVALSGKKRSLKETNPEAAEKRDELIAVWCELHEPQFGREYAREFGADEKAALALIQRTGKEPSQIMEVVTRAWRHISNPKAWTCRKAVTLKGLNAYWSDLQAELDSLNGNPGSSGLDAGKAKMAAMLAKTEGGKKIAIKIDLENRLKEITGKLKGLAEDLQYPSIAEKHPEKVSELKAIKAEEKEIRSKLDELRKEVQESYFAKNETTETTETTETK